MFTQLVLNGLISGIAFAAIGLSFSVIYAPAKFLNFAHGATYAVAAYAALAVSSGMHAPLFLAIAAGVIAAAVLGCACECCIYRPLRKRNASSLAILVASLGLYVVVQNLISLLAGDEPRSFGVDLGAYGLAVLGGRIALTQLILAAGSAASIVATYLALKLSPSGKAVRAVASDAELALIRGINVNYAVLWAFALGSGAVGLVGALAALDIDLVPTMGLNALMMGVVAMIIGGTRSVGGIVVGGLMLGLTQNFAVWKIGSQWQDGIAFAIMVVFIVIRPQGVSGLFSHKSRV